MTRSNPIKNILMCLSIGLSASSCAHMGQGEDHATVPGDAPAVESTTRFMAVPQEQNLSALLDAVGDAPVVYLGETHSRYGDHLLHREILEGLYARNPSLVIGMEAFQRPYQAALDAYIAGEIDEAEMLRRTEWYKRWSFDYRNYRPILEFAQDRRIPVIALNLPSEVTRTVGAQGIDALSDDQKAMLPKEIDRTDKAYEAELREIFDQHPGKEHRRFERFLNVQLLWDEGMAETAAKALERHPDRRLALIAGTGHLANRSGIPNRLDRRLNQRGVLILPAGHLELRPGMADYIAFAPETELPPAAMFGVMLSEDDDGVSIAEIMDGGAAADSELSKGDRIIAISGTPTTTISDVKIVLLDVKPGDTLPVTVERSKLFGGTEQGTLEFTFGAPPKRPSPHGQMGMGHPKP